MQKILHSPIFRPIRLQYCAPIAAFSSLRDIALESFNLANEVVALINSGRRIKPALDKIARFLNREVVNSVLRSQVELKKDPRISFQFFVWGAGVDRFRSGFSRKLIVDLLLSDDSGDLFDLYWSVLDEFRNEKRSLHADAFAVLILGYWRLKRAEKAVETFGRMKDYGCEPNRAAYNVILNVLVKENVMLLAWAVYDVMLKSNCVMHCDTYNVLMDGLCKSGATEDALILFDEMTNRGISPNRITYTVIICGLCNIKRTNDALKLFHLMKNSGCKPDARACEALLVGFCKSGQVDKAFKLFESFRNDGYKVGTRGYGSLIDGLIRDKRIDEAEKFFQEISDEGLVPDCILYTIMMHGLCGAGRMESAMNMLRDMIGRGVMPDAQCYTVLIKGFCDRGLLDQAQSLKLEMSQHGQFPNTYTYSILICCLYRNGLLEEARQIFNDMEKFNCFPSTVTYNTLIDGLCKAGKLEEAHLMLYKMEIGKNPSLFLRLSQGADRVLDRESLQKMVENSIDSGSILKAYKLLTQLANSSVAPDIWTYNTLINGMCKAGQVHGALKLFEVLQLKGHLPDSVTYTTLMEGLQRIDREEDAYKLLVQMNQNGFKPSLSVYQSLMIWSCRRRKIPTAFDIWLRYMRSLAGVEGESFKLTEEYFEKGDFEQAVRSLLEMDIKFEDYDSAFYSIWLVGLCQSKRVDAALKTFSLLEEFNVPVSAPGCVKLVNALRSKGKLHEAVDIILYTMEKGYQLKPHVFNSLLKVLLGSKDEAMLAFELLDKMKSVGYDVDSYLHNCTKSLLYRHHTARILDTVSVR